MSSRNSVIDGFFTKFIFWTANSACKTFFKEFKSAPLFLDNGPSLGWRESYNKPYQWLNYNEALLRAKNFGSGLVSCGLTPGTSTNIGIYAQNCPEWILTEQAMYCYSMVLVPLYDTLGPDACAFIIKQGLFYWYFNILCFPVCNHETKAQFKHGPSIL